MIGEDLSHTPEEIVILTNGWEDNGLPSQVNNFLTGITCGPGRNLDSVIKWAKDMVELAGRDNMVLLAIAEDLLCHINDYVIRYGHYGTGQAASDGIDSYQQERGPKDSRLYEQAIEDWRTQLVKTFRERYTASIKTFKPRVPRHDLTVVYGFIRAMNEDSKKLPPLPYATGNDFQRAAAAYVGVQI